VFDISLMVDGDDQVPYLPN